MKAVLSAYVKAGFMLLLSPFIAVAAGLIVLFATWKAVIAGLVGVHR